MTEELRDYLLRRFTTCYSGYGATDLEVGIAAETPVSIALRRLARARPEIRCRPLRRRPAAADGVPVNPLLHWIEVTGDRELVITISRLDLLAPRIRYNVHDQGGVATFARMEGVLRVHGWSCARSGSCARWPGPAARSRGWTWCRCRSCG